MGIEKKDGGKNKKCCKKVEEDKETMSMQGEN